MFGVPEFIDLFKNSIDLYYLSGYPQPSDFNEKKNRPDYNEICLPKRGKDNAPIFLVSEYLF
jgi:hypothetical protein